MTNRNQYTIGSRGSRLALWQAEWVKSELTAHHPHLEVRLEIIKTTGDVNRTSPLSMIGGKGLFTKELEDALYDRRIDLAVHSLKDLPTALPPGLTIAAITEREDARDALVLGKDSSGERASVKSLAEGSVIGTSSLRRLAQIKHLRQDIGIKDLRGNVDTRLRKLDAGEYTAVVLAAAGLKRLGFTERINSYIPITDILPAVGQGALGIETREDDAELIELLAVLDHTETRAACAAERALLNALGGGCQVPIAAHGRVSGDRLRLDGLVAGLSGDTLIRDVREGALEEAIDIGRSLAEELRARGADSLLSGLVS